MAHDDERDQSDAARDRELGMDRPISRRDFLNGAALGAGAIMASGWLERLHAGQMSNELPPPGGVYPPALTGMRGSQEGSYAIAHSLRDGTFWKTAGAPLDTGERYDLVVVGAGISGLAAANFFRAHAGPSARVLVIDNHDDFGGHARRDEFRVDGRLLLANGGTFAIESPFPYSKEAHGLLDSLGIDPPALEKRCVDRELYKGLTPAFFFDKETFGAERLVPGVPRGSGDDTPSGKASGWQTWLATTPFSEAAKRDIARIQEEKTDWMTGLSQAEKRDRLSRMSYVDFLLKVVKASPDVIPMYQTRPHGLYGIGADAVPALDCWALGYPGFTGLGLDRTPTGRLSFTARGAVTQQDEYFFHFPDGNATIARLLVRRLIPSAVPGHTVDDVVTSVADYSRLDRAGSPVRIRLNSTVVRVRHTSSSPGTGDVEVTYAAGSEAHTVRAKAAVLACWNMVIPYLCDDLPAAQKTALHYGVKVPLVYTAVAVRNWASFQKLGVQRVSTPGMYHSSVSLEIPVSIGGYKFAKSPSDPILIRMLRTPCKPGLPARDQQRAGRYDLQSTPYATFERNIRDQLTRVLGGGGFDPARDIAAITVNRWAHGYAYEYNPMWDEDWSAGQSPAEIGRQRFGRIAIANSDAAAAAYTDQAINQGWRAVQELVSTA